MCLLPIMWNQDLVDYLVIPNVVLVAFCTHCHFLPSAGLCGGYHYFRFTDENIGSDGRFGFESEICLTDFKSNVLSVLPYNGNPEFFLAAV